MKLKSIVAIGLSVLSLIACGKSEPKPTKESFQQALQARHDQFLPYCYLYSEFPAKSIKLDITGTNDTMEHFTKVGFLERKGDEYSLTEEGRKHYVPKAHPRTGEGGICFGHLKVTSVDEILQPDAKAALYKVKYSYTIEGLPTWATSKEWVAFAKSAHGINPHVYRLLHVNQALENSNNQLYAVIGKSEQGWDVAYAADPVWDMEN